MADTSDLPNGEQNEDRLRKNQMEFIVEQQARIDANLESITERLDRLTENVDAFVVETRDAINNLTLNVDASVVETRDAMNNLIIANEGTRELAQQVARLARQTSRRVSDLEEK